MSADLRELYQEVILDHHLRPRNFAALPDADRVAEGYNPLCGDRVKLFLRVEDDVIVEATFQGAGCAISTASASVMTEALAGRSVAEAEALADAFQALVTRPEEAPGEGPDLGKLEVFAGVRDYPVRIKCATLAWHALRAALAQEGAE